jgi:putative ABC transport system ATP-binding protein
MIDQQPALQLSHVSAIEAGSLESGFVIEDVSFACASGTWTALMGPVAAVKTSVLRCAAGLDPLATGEVRLAEGLRLAHVGLRPATELLATIRTLASALHRLPVETAELLSEALHRLGLWEERDTPAICLPASRQRAAAVVVAVAERPDVLLADGLTDELPPDAATAILDLLRDLVDRQGLCVVASAEDLASLERADVVVLFAGGRVVETRIMP